MAACDGHLLDNNVISVLARPTDRRYAAIEGHLKALGAAPIMLPVIAIAEIEFGMAKAINPDAAQRAQLQAFFNRYPLHLGIDDNTVENAFGRWATPKNGQGCA